MAGRYIVRKFKNGVKHFWDTDKKECIHWSKVKELIPEKEFDDLFEQFNDKQHNKPTKQLPKLADILTEIVSVYSDKTSIEEIIGALEMSKTHALSLHKTKNKFMG